MMLKGAQLCEMACNGFGLSGTIRCGVRCAEWRGTAGGAGQYGIVLKVRVYVVIMDGIAWYEVVRGGVE